MPSLPLTRYPSSPLDVMALILIVAVTPFGIVLIRSLFDLLPQEYVPCRPIRLLSGGQLRVATQALDDVGTRVSRYLLIQRIVNACFGACIAPAFIPETAVCRAAAAMPH